MSPPDFHRYVDNIVHRDLSATAEQLARLRPTCVVAGQEPGVALADALSERLRLPTNGTGLSLARRDKYEMIETLRAAGLHCAAQFKNTDPEELVAWAAARGSYPCVVKPLRSAATDGVSICHNEDDVRSAAKQVLSSVTVFGDQNTEVLIQSYLSGPEYVVDMVSMAGARYLCGVWEYRKRLIHSTRNIYDHEVLLPEDENPVPELRDYVEKALDALGIRFGPSHAEVILTPEGPALVEVGARLGGNMHPGFHDLAAGGNQADLTALAYVRPEEFLGSHGRSSYRKRQEAWCYTTPTELDGIVLGINDEVVQQIQDLESVFEVNVKLAPGSRIVPTIDLFTSTLRVFMASGNVEELKRDYQIIRRLKDQVYILE